MSRVSAILKSLADDAESDVRLVLQACEDQPVYAPFQRGTRLARSHANNMRNAKKVHKPACSKRVRGIIDDINENHTVEAGRDVCFLCVVFW